MFYYICIYYYCEYLIITGILAYMHLIEQSSKLDAEMYNYIEENRPTHEESLGVHGHVVTVDPSIHLLTMSSVKNLSHNIAR